MGCYCGFTKQLTEDIVEELKLSDEQVMMLIVRFMALTLRITPEQGARCFKALVVQAKALVVQAGEEGQNGTVQDGDKGSIITDCN